MIKESLLHYVWKYKLFDQTNIETTAGHKMKLISTGKHNSDAGPDFFNARIIMDNIEWAGNIEMHIKSSDWYKHKHQYDKNYDNVILHVVAEMDKEIVLQNGEIIPTLEIGSLIPDNVLKNYEHISKSRDWIPCQQQIKNVKLLIVNSCLDRMLTERLERKTDEINQLLKLQKQNWEEICYQLLAKNFGFKVNALPFQMLAQSLPLNILAKHKNNILQIEALLFGQAGFLEEECIDDYHLVLQKEYQFLKKKFKLKNLDRHIWKFLRLRPANFPTIRIAQFAQLVFKSSKLFSKLLEAKSLKEIIQYFELGTSEYWQTHYTFGKQSNKKNKHLGKAAIDIILINTVIPVLFAYGKSKSKVDIEERALDFLSQIKAEKNNIIDHWASVGIKADSAFQSQALLQLKNNYCKNKKCLNCTIGAQVLKLN